MRRRRDQLNDKKLFPISYIFVDWNASFIKPSVRLSYVRVCGPISYEFKLKTFHDLVKLKKLFLFIEISMKFLRFLVFLLETVAGKITIFSDPIYIAFRYIILYVSASIKFSLYISAIIDLFQLQNVCVR